jgi:pyruvate/2-oxoglutarate dehydrogenase complex dihydrolipoamide dehydrogenase (E3) component
MTENVWDVIVVGGGPVGQTAAQTAVQGGLTAVVTERELAGGECHYWACIPSKALLRSGMVWRAARKVGGAREAITTGLDVESVFARRNGFVDDWHDEGEVQGVQGTGAGFERGQARITGVKQVSVTTANGDVKHLTAKHAVVVCSGSDAYVPDVPGLRELKPWTNREATSARRVPASLTVLGGGATAVEMATAYLSFGTAVTLVARGALLTGQEPFAGQLVAQSLEHLGATVRLGVATRSATRTDDAVVVELGDGSTITSEEILAATGRRPRTTDLGLETIGLDPERWLETDDTLMVRGYDWLYAAGDSNNRALLTHQGKYQARAAGSVIAARAAGAPVLDAPWQRHVASADHAAVAQVIFCEPEVATVGLTAADAAKAGCTTRVVDADMAAVAGANILADGYTGQARMVIDEGRQVLLGVTFVGQAVSELVQAATVAVVGEVPLDRLRHAVPPFPTMNEIWLRLMENYEAAG